ncbi:hypothetical protein Barb6XT_02935 [Bacteroidales bacterium Barb6XT]|nr:hypothetical protein Barb6XT_02935 [Bacteroidales bacterium Barb6XT]
MCQIRAAKRVLKNDILFYDMRAQLLFFNQKKQYAGIETQIIQ